MPQIQDAPTFTTLHRFRIDSSKISPDLRAWRLDFPYHNVCQSIADGISAYLGKDNVSIPYRMLNNILVSLAPLGHGFEFVNKARYALTITTSSETNLPNPQRLHTVIFQWMLWWIDHHTSDDNTIKSQLETIWRNEATKMPARWQWEPISVRHLIESFELGNGLNFNVLPSVLAMLMHDMVTTVYGQHQIRWRKVQDGESKKLSLVGFADNRPIHATYEVQRRHGRSRGDGYFAFLLEFSLETQAGSSEPWMFLSLHAQRYAYQALYLRRSRSQRTALLVGPNRFRLDDSPLNATLLKLRVQREDEKLEWSDYPPALLQAVGLRELPDPANIFAEPQMFWHPITSGNEHDQDEFYLIHDEGDRYGEHRRGHDLAAGLPLADLDEVTRAVVAQLPMLVPDRPLTPDANAQLMPQRWTSRPKALRNFRMYANSRNETLRRDHANLVSEALQRAQSGKPVTITIFWHNYHTYIGLCRALHNLLMVEEGNLPDNMILQERQIRQRELFWEVRGRPYKPQHQKRVKQWREFIASESELNGDFALVELLRDDNPNRRGRSHRRTRSTTRQAFAAEGIATQFILPLDMKADKDHPEKLVFMQNGSEHRANSAVRDLLLHQTGMLYGEPAPVYQLAGMVQSADLIGIYLKENQNGLRFPMAVKLTMEGYCEAKFPREKKWIPYSEAGPHLGNLLSGEWDTLRWNPEKWSWELSPASKFCLTSAELNHFVCDIVKSTKRPSIIVIEADKWRNRDRWPQLRNPDLGDSNSILDFGHVVFDRNDKKVDNVLAIIRMRSDRETPQYISLPDRCSNAF